MNNSIKKLGMAIFGLTIAGQVSLQGNTYYNGSCNDYCCPCPCSCGQFFIEAGVLGFRAYEGGLTSICDNVDIVDTTVDGITISTLEGHSRDPDFNWNAGFRVGAGYEFANCVGIGAFYTHFNSHTNSKHHDLNTLQWKINFDEVDALLFREYDLCGCFIVTPYGGVRYANIDQTLTTHLLSNNAGAITTSDGRIKEHFYGVGPLFGVDGDWGIGSSGFSLYADVAVSLLYGSFRVTSDQSDLLGTTLNVNHLRDHLQAYQTVLDTGFGIRWRTCFCDNELLVQLGFEQHRFFNHNQFCGYGDLSLDGVSLAIGLLF